MEDDPCRTVSKLLGRVVMPGEAQDWLLTRYLESRPSDTFPGRDRAIELKRREISRLLWNEKCAAERIAAAAGGLTATEFYASQSWKALRYKALHASNGRCALCGRSAAEHGVVLHVDHIKPRSLHPDLALELTNLQVLCEDCNMGKGNRDDTDWRPASDAIN